MGPMLEEGGTAFRLEFAPDPRFLAGARMFAAAVARHFGCTDEVVQDVKVAVTEAAANAVKAHGDQAPSEPVRLEARLHDSHLTFWIVDSGGGFDPAGHHPPAPGTTEGQVGLLLIRALFPEAVIAPNDQGGMTVRFGIDVDA